jgi:hypothetical protein
MNEQSVIAGLDPAIHLPLLQNKKAGLSPGLLIQSANQAARLHIH